MGLDQCGVLVSILGSSCHIIWCFHCWNISTRTEPHHKSQEACHLRSCLQYSNLDNRVVYRFMTFEFSSGDQRFRTNQSFGDVWCMCDKLVSASASDTPFVSPTSLPKYRLSIAYFHIENSYLSIRYMYFRQAGVGVGSFYILCHSMRRNPTRQWRWTCKLARACNDRRD